MTKTEMAELIVSYLDLFETNTKLTSDELLTYERHFSELIGDLRSKIVEQVEQSIEDEEQEIADEDVNSEAFGNGIMEGE